MIDGIYHVGYWTDDIDKAIAMYRSVFGAEVFQEATGADGKTRLAFLHVGQTDVEIIQPADQSVLAGQSGLVIHHVGYLVADIHASIAALKAKGVKFAAEATNRTPTGAEIIYLDTASTNGARIHLTQI